MRVIDKRHHAPDPDPQLAAQELMHELALDAAIGSCIEAVRRRPPGWYIQRLHPEKRRILVHLKSPLSGGFLDYR